MSTHFTADVSSPIATAPRAEQSTIEHLCFRVPPGGQAAFLEQDDHIWGSPLRNHPGFLRKEVWLDGEDPELIHLIIYWSSRAAWKAFPPEQVEALDRQMQPFYVRLEQVKEYQLWQPIRSGERD